MIIFGIVNKVYKKQLQKDNKLQNNFNKPKES